MAYLLWMNRPMKMPNLSRTRSAALFLWLSLCLSFFTWTRADAATATQAAAPTLLRPNDFPTLDRVVYVQECMRAHPGPSYEMTSKCVCVLDSLAKDLSYDDFVTMNTVSKASTIAGERGGAIRDAPGLAEQLTRYRSMQAQAEKACFIGANGR